MGRLDRLATVRLRSPSRAREGAWAGLDALAGSTGLVTPLPIRPLYPAADPLGRPEWRRSWCRPHQHSGASLMRDGDSGRKPLAFGGNYADPVEERRRR